MRTRLATIGLLLGLGTSTVLAGDVVPLAPRPAPRPNKVEIDKKAAAALILEREGRTASSSTSASVAEAFEPLQQALLPLLGPTVRVTGFKLVKDENEFFALAQRQAEPDSTVFYDDANKEVVALDQPLTPERLRHIAHEAARGSAHGVFGVRAHAWFEEGLGCYVENGERRGGDLVLGKIDPDRRNRVRAELKLTTGQAAIERVLGLEASAYVRGERVHRDVALTWAFFHYLVHGGTKPRKAFDAYVKELRTSRDKAKAEAALFAILPKADLAKGFESFIR